MNRLEVTKGRVIAIFSLAFLLGFGSAFLVFRDSWPWKLGGHHKTMLNAPMLKRYEIATSTPSGKEPQIVVFSFDGSRSLPFWDATFAFQDEMEKANKPIRFTYFISGVYFLAPQFKDLYDSPDHGRGVSEIGFADSPEDVSRRIERVNEAVIRGNEIGSHANGHYDGTWWSEAEWKKEFDSFNNLVFHAVENNHLATTTNQLLITPADVVGFRAPLLAHNPAMHRALVSSGYRYDGSLVGWNREWPKRLEGGLWEFPLKTIRFKGGHYSIGMDYSIYQMQTSARSTLVKDSPEWKARHDELVSVYLDYFKAQYEGARIPVYIANHFNLWNDGLYWEAMKDTARLVCGEPEVYCVTYRELATYLEYRVRTNTATTTGSGKLPDRILHNKMPW